MLSTARRQARARPPRAPAQSAAPGVGFLAVRADTALAMMDTTITTSTVLSSCFPNARRQIVAGNERETVKCRRSAGGEKLDHAALRRGYQGLSQAEAYRDRPHQDQQHRSVEYRTRSEVAGAEQRAEQHHHDDCRAPLRPAGKSEHAHAERLLARTPPAAGM